MTSLLQITNYKTLILQILESSKPLNTAELSKAAVTGGASERCCLQRGSTTLRKQHAQQRIFCFIVFFPQWQLREN